MITRAVPARDAVGIFAIVTTDLAANPFSKLNGELDAAARRHASAVCAHIGQLIATVGLERVGAPHVRHLTGPLWEMRFQRVGDGIARAHQRRVSTR